MKKEGTFRKKVFDIIRIGQRGEILSEIFDIFITAVIIINLAAVVFSTFDEADPYMNAINVIETVTMVIFTVEYLLRLWTAVYLYPDKNNITAALRFMISWEGIIELVSILPFYLPDEFPLGIIAFRLFRIFRILRLFTINEKYDAFNVITDVIKEKRKQLLSSIAMIILLMIASSLGMYSIEHEAQPDNFRNAFSGIWWAASTLLTIGYGDIYPITVAGKILAIFISFLGVGMVAIPTGIISAGFVEKYSEVKRLSEPHNRGINLIDGTLEAGHPWCGMSVDDIVFPPGVNLILIIRNGKQMVPHDVIVLEAGDGLVFEGFEFEKKDKTPEA